jgi:DNA-binding transcriptional LysR family regulator
MGKRSRRRRHRSGNVEARPDDPCDWIVIDGRRYFVVGYTPGGVPSGYFEDAFDESPQRDEPTGSRNSRNSLLGIAAGNNARQAGKPVDLGVRAAEAGTGIALLSRRAAHGYRRFSDSVQPTLESTSRRRCGR